MKRKLTLFSLAIAIGSALHAQPVRVSDIIPGVGGSGPQRFTAYNGKLYFVAQTNATGQELWEWDGSTAPTMVTEIKPGPGAGVMANQLATYKPFLVMGGKMYFTGISNTVGEELFEYTGSGVPTAIDLTPGTNGSGATFMTTAGGRIFFSSRDIGWYEPSTAASGFYDADPALPNSYVSEMVAMGNDIYFVGQTAAYGFELMKLDPLINTISLVADTRPGTTDGGAQFLTVVGSKLYFTASPGTGQRYLYSYNGVSVTRVSDTMIYNDSRPFVVMGNDIYFSGGIGAPFTQLYRHNLSTGTTARVATINPNGGSQPHAFAEYNGAVYFSADNGTNGHELWKYDGTTASMVADIWSGSSGSGPREMTVWNGAMIFSASDSAHGNELWRLGTPTGVTNLRFTGEVSCYPNPAASVSHLDITLKEEGRLSVSITDMMGREVYAIPAQRYNSGKTQLEIPLQDLATGIYQYNLRDGSGSLLAAGKLEKQ